MSHPHLTTYDALGPHRDDVRAVVLVLHGGKPRSREPVDRRSASWRRAGWLARAVAPRLHEAQAGVWLARYHGEVPVALLGHSMGARVAVHAADDPSVRGVVGLAPWWSAQDPVRTLTGLSLRAAHGRRDRITSFRETTAYVARAEAVADSVALRDMGPLGHYMISGADRWHDVAAESVLEVLGLQVPSPDR